MKYEIEHAEVRPQDVIKACVVCESLTRWKHPELGKHLCSTECADFLWREVLSDSPEMTQEKRRLYFEDEIKGEMSLIDDGANQSKAILIVAHNQHGYLQKCIDSIEKHTENYKIYLWDNGSDPQLDEAMFRSKKNLGFIKPNNIMASFVEEEVLICLNSDTEVFRGWDKLICSFLNRGYTQVGYAGCVFDEHLNGKQVCFGEEIDYVLGWCFGMKTVNYKSFGLFDENYRFAYFEDADLSLRMKQNGKKIYALHCPLVHHYGNKTADFKSDYLKSFIKENKTTFENRWGRYLTLRKISPKITPNIWGSPGKKFS